MNSLGIHTRAIPFAKDVSPRGDVASLAYLSKSVIENRDVIYSMDATKFEIFVGSVLKEYHDCEVRHVGQSRDHGVDLIAIIKDEPVLIQVKRRTRPAVTEGVETVKLLLATMFDERASSGILVTSASHFSKDARDWASSSRMRDSQYQMELVDVGDLLDIMKAIRHSTTAPWEAFRSNPVPGNRIAFECLSAHGWQPIGFDARPSTEDDSNLEWGLVERCDGDIVLSKHSSETLVAVYPHSALGVCASFSIPRGIEIKDADYSNVGAFIATLARCANRSKTETDGEFINSFCSLPQTMQEKLAAKWERLDPKVIHYGGF